MIRSDISQGMAHNITDCTLQMHILYFRTGSYDYFHLYMNYLSLRIPPMNTEWMLEISVMYNRKNSILTPWIKSHHLRDVVHFISDCWNWKVWPFVLLFQSQYKFIPGALLEACTVGQTEFSAQSLDNLQDELNKRSSVSPKTHLAGQIEV